MWNWLRIIPTPGYGRCGGAKRDCSIPKPRDWMDLAFEEHDKDLAKAKTKEDDNNADKKLAKALRSGDPKKLKLWGKIYLWGAKMVFKLMLVIGLTVCLSGCAIHYQNEKGIKAKASDIITPRGNIDKGKAHFWSKLDIWIPWKLKE